MGQVVVVGGAELAERVRRLLPNFEVLGHDSEPELEDPVTALETVRSLLDSGSGPDSLVCSALPGFALLGQVPRLSPSRCFVTPEGSVWPGETVRWMAEAVGMIVLPALEALPAMLLGRSGTPLPAPRGLTAVVEPAPAAPRPPSRARQAPPAPTYDWASATPVQVPPPPVSLDPTPAPAAPQVIDAGGPPQTAYEPTDVLRPLRPRRR